VTRQVPAIVRLNDPRALDFHGRKNASERTDRRDGWRKIALFSLYFQTNSALKVSFDPNQIFGLFDFIKNGFPKPNIGSDLGWGNFFAWSWPDQKAVDEAFDALSCDGALLVPPILQVAILNRHREDVTDFVDAVSKKDFDKVIPLHFDAPVKANSNDFRAAFQTAGLVSKKRRIQLLNTKRKNPLPPRDLEFLKTLETSLVKSGAIAPLKK